MLHVYQIDLRQFFAHLKHFSQLYLTKTTVYALNPSLLNIITFNPFAITSFILMAFMFDQIVVM